MEIDQSRKEKKSLVNSLTRPFARPTLLISVFQLINTLVPYLIGWYVIYWSLHRGNLLITLSAIVITAGFYVRLFVLFHDCVHSSLFKHRVTNEIVGRILGVMTFTPYHWWRIDHLIHHNLSGDLDCRDISFGDIKMLTVEEYLRCSPRQRLLYRIFRNPFVLFGVLPTLLFLVRNRFVLRTPPSRKERLSVYGTNFSILIISLLAWKYIGFRDFAVTQIAILATAASVGVWLFYLQHQFEGVYWSRKGGWDFVDAGLEGSSFYKLPRVLQWFTANIGFHHIHHLDPRVPNYLLEKCHNSNELFRRVPFMTLRSSMKCLQLRLWDEKRKVIITLAELRNIDAADPASADKPDEAHRTPASAVMHQSFE